MKKVGTYTLGSINVDIFLVPGISSAFETNPKNGKNAKLEIGADHNEWWSILEELLHEALEFLMVLYHVVYVPPFMATHNSTTYVFHFDHGDFTKIIEDAAYFVAKAQNDLCKAWKEYQKGLKIK